MVNSIINIKIIGSSSSSSSGNSNNHGSSNRKISTKKVTIKEINITNITRNKNTQYSIIIIPMNNGHSIVTAARVIIRTITITTPTTIVTFNGKHHNLRPKTNSSSHTIIKPNHIQKNITTSKEWLESNKATLLIMMIRLI